MAGEARTNAWSNYKTDLQTYSIASLGRGSTNPPLTLLSPHWVRGERGLCVGQKLLLALFLLLAPVVACGGEANLSTNSFLPQPLALDEAVNIALQRNPTLRAARKEIEASQGVIIQSRALALPKLRLNGAFNAVENSDVDRPPVSIPGFNFGTDKNWLTQIRIVQSIYEGGRVGSALRAGKLASERAFLNYQTAEADTVLAVEVSYFDVLLGEQQVKVQEASVELLTNELQDTKRRFDAGTVPRFNVLRAEVELANAQPRLIRARNLYRVSKNNLVNLMGADVPREMLEDIPINLSGTLEAQPLNLEIGKAVALALEHRTELESLRKLEGLRREDIINARSGYKPRLEAYAGYDAHSSIFTEDLSHDVYGWIAGVQLNWDLFDGLQTRGRIKEAQARKDQAALEIEDTSRRIELEVRTALSNFREADELLKSQEKVMEEAEEALRLATARAQAGTATQLDVLSAQTALTESRTTHVQALHDYEVARAKLERAVGNTQVQRNAARKSGP
jgi:outer membrane protein